MRNKRRKRRKRSIAVAIIYVAVLCFCVISAISTLKKGKEKKEILDIPDSLIQLKENNPEAENFVDDYNEDKDLYSQIDISGEVSKGTIPLFIQWDKRWGYKKYGDDFFAVTGCGPTCLSMVYACLTGKSDMNPYEIAQKAEEEGYYVDGIGTSWDMMTGLAAELGLNGHEVVFDKENIIQTLNNDEPIICVMGPGDFTTTGHFIVLTGVDSNGDIIVHDPNSIKRSKKRWSIDDIMKQTKNLWSYQ